MILYGILSSYLNGRYHIKARVYYYMCGVQPCIYNFTYIFTDCPLRTGGTYICIYCTPFNWVYTSLCFRQEIIYIIQAIQVVTAWVIGGGIDILKTVQRVGINGKITSAL